MLPRPAQFEVIAFDADDTLWENEALFRQTQDQIADLLRDYVAPDQLFESLLDVERRNVGLYGFGIKGFVLSFIEAAIEACDGHIPQNLIKEIINAGQNMLQHPVDVLPHVQATLDLLAPQFKLLLITKGDLLDQQRKIAASGLMQFFCKSHIVSVKDQATYEAIFAEHNVAPERVMMIGNSMKSDVVPPLKAGAWGTYLPHNLMWDLEKAPAPQSHPRYNQCSEISEIPALISKLKNSNST